MQLARGQAQHSRPARASRGGAVRVLAKVSIPAGAPRVVRGKAFVTKDVSDRLRLASARQVGGVLGASPPLALSPRPLTRPNHRRTLTRTRSSPPSTSRSCRRRCGALGWGVFGGRLWALAGCCSLNTHARNTHTQPDEYEKLGSYALIGLPDEEYQQR